MSKLTRDDIALNIHNQFHPPKPRKVDPFGRVLEWEGEDEPAGKDLEELKSPYASCLPKFDNRDVSASMARWETFAAEIVKSIPASLRKAAAVFHKAVEREFFHSTVDDDRDDGVGDLYERKSAYAACMPKSSGPDAGAVLAAWETFAAEIVKAIPASLRRAAAVFHKAVEREFFHSAVDDDMDDAEGGLDEARLTEGKKGKLKKSLKFKNGDEAPAGTAVEVSFDKDKPEMALLKLDYSTDSRDYQDEPAKINAGKLYLYVAGFGKPPSIKTMMKWSDDGMSKTVTGKKVEPDGVGPDGSPSWLRVLGYI